MPDDGTFASDMAWAEAVDAKAAETEPKVTHTSTLMERHRITMPVGATGDNVAVARLHAEAYARARGFEISPGSFQVIATSANGMPMVADGGTLGVAFDVIVGKGDISTDQSIPGVLDRWTFGGAVKWWADILERARPGHLAPVIAAIDGRGRVNTRPGGGVAFGDPTRTKGLLDMADDVLDAPVIERGQWRGPDALAGPDVPMKRGGIRFPEDGPQPGQGAQSGTGSLPPWLRRGTDEDPDL